jgi:hypothetical protein
VFVKIYADSGPRRARQFLSDVLMVAWLAFWIWLATRLYDLVEKLAGPGRSLESGGNGMADGLTDAGDKVGGIPGVGGAISRPFDSAAGAARSLADAGRQQQDVVHHLAWVLALLLLLVPVAVVLLGWLPVRVRWIVRASSAAGLRTDPAGRDLLALRALANQPLRRLAAVDPDPVGAWRRADNSTMDALATIELRRLGLRPR